MPHSAANGAAGVIGHPEETASNEFDDESFGLVKARRVNESGQAPPCRDVKTRSCLVIAVFSLVLVCVFISKKDEEADNKRQAVLALVKHVQDEVRSMRKRMDSMEVEINRTISNRMDSMKVETNRTINNRMDSMAVEFNSIKAKLDQHISQQNGPDTIRARWKSDACQKFYNQASELEIGSDSTTWEGVSLFWLPGKEVNAEKKASWPRGGAVQQFKRVITYEDVAVPPHPPAYQKIGEPTAWCMPYFIRSPVRAVKVDLAKMGEVSIMHPAIWKVASTTISKLLKNPPFSNASNPHQTSLKPQNPHKEDQPCVTGWSGSNTSEDAQDGGCHKQTSANTVQPMDSLFKFAFVRDPLVRFAAGVHEHGVWDDKNMSHNVKDGRSWAKKFEAFPHGFRNCALATQSYFLSATSIYGEPIEWDFIAKLEDFDTQWPLLGNRIGTSLSVPKVHSNPSGSEDLSRRVLDTFRHDLQIVCRVCKVYLQDYVCLGYTVPEACCARKCADVSIHIPDNLLNLAC